ncbi:MAG: orotidine-5'-phosphate decarboxylase [Planctomycetes bacterium]|nr:orotidine-5'-phosphate decarboxylase [Planctomycetota bacterium]
MPLGRQHPADSLLKAIDAMGAPVCVGLDPVLERIPSEVRIGTPAASVARFSLGIIDAVRGIVPCIKVQAACFERYGADGFKALEEVMVAAKAAGLLTILDAKRGDIGISAEHYAAALFGHFSADWCTVNAYLGIDGVTPFLAHGGVFALVRTSNPASDALQSLQLTDGRSVAEAVASLVAATGAQSIGTSGFSSLGAVVGATKAQDATSLRAVMPQQLFLVPGYGAQGGTADDVRRCFRPDGKGAIVTASRSVIYPTCDDGEHWKSAVERAARTFAAEIRAVCCAAASQP